MWAELDTAAVWRRQIEITATRGSVSQSLSVIDGELTQDSRRALRWSGTLTVAVPTPPTSPTDILTPFGTLVTVQLGIIHPNGTVVQSTAYGQYTIARASAADTPEGAAVSLTLTDLAERVALYRYESPLRVPAGTDLAAVADTVLQSRLGVTSGLASTGILTPKAYPLGANTASDPWRELVDIFDAAGLSLFYNEQGDLEAQPAPTAGVGYPVGQADFEIDFEHRPANVIVARGESADPTIPPIQQVVVDDDPGSPTYAGPSPGSTPYGRITDFVDSPMIINDGLAIQAANERLAQRVGGEVTATRAFDPGMRPGDTLLWGFRRVLIDAVTVSLTGTTGASGRIID